jgi:hypothetical protein
MVTDTLRNLATWFRGKAPAGGAEMNPAACDLVAHQLDDAADQVAALLGQPAQPLPPAAAVAHIPANVLCLSEARRARAARATGGDWGAA